VDKFTKIFFAITIGNTFLSLKPPASVKVLHKICALFKKLDPYCIRPGTLKLVDLSEDTEPGNVVIYSQHSAHKITLKGDSTLSEKPSLVSQATPTPCQTSHCITTPGQHNLGSQPTPAPCRLSLCSQPIPAPCQLSLCSQPTPAPCQLSLCSQATPAPCQSSLCSQATPAPVSPTFVHNQPLSLVSSAFVYKQPLPLSAQPLFTTNPCPLSAQPLFTTNPCPLSAQPIFTTNPSPCHSSLCSQPTSTPFSSQSWFRSCPKRPLFFLPLDLAIPFLASRPSHPSAKLSSTAGMS
jgi:hypothetical protein